MALQLPVSSYLWVCIFAIVGTAARYFISHLTADVFYASSPNIASSGDSEFDLLVPVIFRDIWSNFIGCFVMGFLVGCESFRARNPTLYTGLTTGFCGCLTTFSAWNTAIAGIFVKGNFLAAFLCLFIGMSLSICSLDFGMAVSTKLFLLNKF